MPMPMNGNCYVLTVCCCAVLINAQNLSLLEEYRRNLVVQVLGRIPFTLGNLAPGSEASQEDVVYYLYTRAKPRNSIDLRANLKLINPKLPIKILIHGWTEHYYADWCRNLTAAYLRKGNYSVVVTDWSRRGDVDYINACRNVKAVGTLMAEFIVERLLKSRKVSLGQIHLISHSLGAHVAAICGQKVFALTGLKLGRITALDPAAPIFDMFPITEDDRLSPDDAHFVDIVHTDAGILGFKTSIGVADFYPNGGNAVQPNCPSFGPEITYQDWFCSHASSHRFFLRSVQSPKPLRAVKCDSWQLFTARRCDANPSVRFGDEVPTNVSGNYFLNLELN